ncbi:MULTISPECIES: hypothetical protein [Enterobacterales]|uniref:hypothetical protein n=1 Tax=Enterobacterales TaxID=91347 RepID=UPI002ED8B57C
MLLTTNEAYAVVNELYDKGTTYAGTIKDMASGVSNIFKLVSYREVDKLIFRFKGMGIKAQPYMHKGVAYIKITGYPSVRRILNGTRYAVNHPKILELGIGKTGLNMAILSGARWCVYFSAAQRVAEFIFSSEHDVATFIGNISMDVAKVIVSIFVTKIAFTVTSLVLGATSVVLPISATIILVVFIGFIITRTLYYIDKRFHLSDQLIESIKEGMLQQQKVMEWNIKNDNSFIFNPNNGLY